MSPRCCLSIELYFRVTATACGRKTFDPAGGIRTTEAPLDELIDVAVYAEHPLSTDAERADYIRELQVSVGLHGRP